MSSISPGVMIIQESESNSALVEIPMKVERQHPMDSPSSKYLMSLQSKQSRNTMVSHLNKVASLFGVKHHHEFSWESLTSDAVYLIRNKFLDDGYSPSAINCSLTAIRKSAQFAFTSEMMEHSQFERIKLVEKVKGKRIRKRRELAKEDIQKFLKACDDGTFKGLRDAALFLLMIGSGLRRAEVIGIRLKDLDLNTRKLIVTGKGNKQRLVGVAKISVQYITEYIEEMHSSSEDDAYLFCRYFKNDEKLNHVVVGKNGKEKEMKLALSSVNYILSKRGYKGNVDRFKPHDLRGTYATKMLRDGKDINQVSILLGHKSISTTQNYDLRAEEEAIQTALDHKIF